MHFSDSKGNVIGICQKGTREITLVNPTNEIRIKKVIANKFMFHYFYNPETGKSIPMRTIIEDSKTDNGDYVYTLG